MHSCREVEWEILRMRFRWWPWVTRRRLERTDAYWCRLLDAEREKYTKEIGRLRKALIDLQENEE